MSCGEPVLGVVIVAYGSADHLVPCVASLFASGYPRLRVVVVDNASPDDGDRRLRAWADGEGDSPLPADWPFPSSDIRPHRFEDRALGLDGAPPPAEAELMLLRADTNRGFAGGVNLGLKALAADPAVDRFWVLNPDTLVEPQTPAALIRRAAEMSRFALIGGRTLYAERPDVIQADLGRVRFWLGRAESINYGGAAGAPPPSTDTANYVPGVSMLASRDFLDQAGLMDEGWFLYYEEIDWALRRGRLPLGFEAEARIRHHAGASIGSHGYQRMASPLSVYFMFRNHLRFVARWAPLCLPTAYMAALAILTKRFARRGGGPQVVAALRGLHQLGPSRAARERLPALTWERVLAPRSTAGGTT